MGDLPVQVATSQKRRVCLKRAMGKEYIENHMGTRKKTNKIYK